MIKSIIRISEYDIICDVCGFEEIVHTGDSDNEVVVHNVNTAIKHARFHKSCGQLLCDKCFKQRYQYKIT